MDVTQLRYLLEKRAQGSLEESEQQQLSEWLADGNNETFLAAVTQWMEEQEGVEFDKPNSEAILGMFNNIIAADKIGEEKPTAVVHRVHFLKTAWFRYQPSRFALRLASAAAILVILL